MLWLDKHARFRNKLSPYIDRRLTPAEAEQMEAHLASCDACRAELERLRATVSALRDLPSAAVPRSFALTPQLLQPRAATPAPSPPLTTGMRLASGAVAVVLAAVLIGDLSGVGGNGDGVGGGDGEQAATAEFRAEGDEAAEEPAPAGEESDEPDTERAQREASSTPALGGFDLANCPTAGAAGGGGAGAGAEGTPAPAPASPAATPTPVDAEVLRACEEAAAGAAAGAPQTMTPAVEDEGAGGEQAEAEAATDDGADLSTVRVAEIVLGLSLVALLGALVVESLLRRRRAV